MRLIARGDQASKYIAKFGQLRKFFLNEGKFCDCQRAIFRAGTFGFEFQ